MNRAAARGQEICFLNFRNVGCGDVLRKHILQITRSVKHRWSWNTFSDVDLLEEIRLQMLHFRINQDEEELDEVYLHSKNCKFLQKIDLRSRQVVL
jgi:hypothetical protein